MTETSLCATYFPPNLVPSFRNYNGSWARPLLCNDTTSQQGGTAPKGLGFLDTGLVCSAFFAS